MPLFVKVQSLLRNLFLSRRVEAELEQEVHSHLELLIDENIRRGMPLKEAQRAARIELGGIEQVKEQVREKRIGNWLRSVISDGRYALRQLPKNPGFTAVAVLTLALGIGANTAIFTLINAVLLKMLPVKNPQELVLLEWTKPQGPGGGMWIDGNDWEENGREVGTPLSYPAFQHLRAENKAFSDMFAFADFGRDVNIFADGQPGLVHGQMATSDIFRTLGLQAVAGRLFAESDDQPGAAPVCVISDGYWKRRFGADPRIAGKPVTVAGVPFTIIGVTPPEFFGLESGSDVQLWVPLSMQPLVEPDLDPKVSLFTSANRWWLIVVARRKPAISAEQATAGLNVIFKPVSEQGVTQEPGKPPIVPSLQLTSASQGLGGLRRSFSRPLFILMGLVGLVLLIACANVANLLLTRATARQKEISVRLSLGASRGRLMRQLLTESVLLAGMGGVLGYLFAYWGSALLIVLISPANRPLSLDINPDLRVLGFTAAACLLTAILFGVAPAWHSLQIDVTPALKQNTQTSSAFGLRLRLGKALVVVQVAVSLLLLFAAGLFVRTLINLRHIDPGFDQNDVLVVGLNPTRAGYKPSALNDFFSLVQQRIAALPGVISATASYHMLLNDGRRGSNVWVEGFIGDGTHGQMNVAVNPVGANFFATMKIPLLRGRDLTERDTEHSPRVAVVNEAFVKRYFADRDPIGRHVRFASDPLSATMEIVGVASNARYESLREAAPVTLYHPYQQADGIPFMYFELRTSMNPVALVPSVRAAVASIDRNVPLFGITTELQQSDELLLHERLFAKLTGFFGLLALLLACVGLYGILSYAVARRTPEIGIRMALGAQQGDVLRMVLGEMGLLVAIGVAIGIPASFAATHLASSLISDLLYGLKGTDVPTIAVAALLLMVVAICAGFSPARRASRVDPLIALRYE
jgi:predicted permease